MTPLEFQFEQDFHRILVRTQSTKITQLDSEKPRRFPESEDNDQKDFTVGRLFYPVIIILRLVACCPVKIVRTKTSIRYEYKRHSLPFRLSLLFTTTTGVILTIWILNGMLDIGVPVRVFRARPASGDWISDSLLKGSKLIRFLDGLIKSAMPIGVWLTFALHWRNLDYFCLFLNEWPKFFLMFKQAFDPLYKIQFDMKWQRNLLLIVWLSPVILLLVVMKPMDYLSSDYPPIISLLFGLCLTAAIIGIRSICYVNDYIILMTMSRAYREIHNGMKVHYALVNSATTRDQVRAWMRLIAFIRTQTARTQLYMSCYNLWAIFEAFLSVLLILSVSTFLFMSGVLGDALQSNFLPFCGIFTVFFSLSLFCKTDMAEDITIREEAIANELIEMETAGDSCEARLEMKIICDVLYKNPTQIRLGNLLTLNKRLLVSFLSQLAAYLVVILQFAKD